MFESALANWLSKYFGLAGRLAALDGELDLNYLLHCDDKKYVVKIMRPNCSASIVDLQVGALHHLKKRAFSVCVPEVITALDDANYKVLEYEGKEYILWVISFVPGTLLRERGSMGLKLSRNLGTSLAELNRRLLDFDHALLDRELKWDLMQAGWISDHVAAHYTQERQAIIQTIVDEYYDLVKTKSTHLPLAVIHNDINDMNVFISEDNVVCGVIDFGDLIRSLRIGEISIAASYAMMWSDDPISCAVEILAGYHETTPLHKTELELYIPLILLRLAVSVTNAVISKAENPQNAYLQISEQKAWELLYQFHSLDREKIYEHMCQACGFTLDSQSIFATHELRKKHFTAGQRLSYDSPLLAVRASRHFVYDHWGRQYLDAYNNVPHVGHCNPSVVQAVSEQLGKINTNSRYLTELPLLYAQALTSRLPQGLNKVFFLNSASEANEIALRLARAATNARHMLVMEHGYHGCTTGTVDVSPHKYHHPNASGKPEWVTEVLQPDPYRGKFWQDDDQSVTPYLIDLQEQIDALISSGVPICAYLSECLPSVGGQVVLHDNYLARAYEMVRKAGGVCIADDVQTALGRLGESFWGFEQQNAVPDILVLGKPLGNGFPVAAVVTTEKIAEAFAQGPEFFSTFGGSSVSAAAGMAVIEALEQENLQDNALQTGTLIRQGFEDIASRYPCIGDVRGGGLFWGLDIVSDPVKRTPDPGQAAMLKNVLYKRLILVGADGPNDNVIKVRPPMTFNAAAATQLLTVLDEVLSEIHSI